MQPEIQEAEGRLASLKKVTPLSKYLAMALFIILPFLGGWIGYTYAPEKIIEVERVIVQDAQVDINESEITERSITSDREDDILIEDFSWELTGVDEYTINWTVSQGAISKYSAVGTAYINFYLIPNGVDSEYRNQNGVRQSIGDGFRLANKSYTFDSNPSWNLILGDSYQVVGELTYRPQDFGCDTAVKGECLPVYNEQDQLLMDQASRYQFVSQPFLVE